MSQAGFYHTPTAELPDKVTCYACGTEKSGWKLNTMDPWSEHVKLKPDCQYLITKKDSKTDLTVADFLKIERFRFQRLNVNNSFISDFIFISVSMHNFVITIRQSNMRRGKTCWKMRWKKLKHPIPMKTK